MKLPESYSTTVLRVQFPASIPCVRDAAIRSVTTARTSRSTTVPPAALAKLASGAESTTRPSIKGPCAGQAMLQPLSQIARFCSSHTHTARPAKGATNCQPDPSAIASLPSASAHAPPADGAMIQPVPRAGSTGGTSSPLDSATGCIIRSMAQIASLCVISFCACPAASSGRRCLVVSCIRNPSRNVVVNRANRLARQTRRGRPCY